MGSQRSDEVLKPDGIVAMIFNGDAIRRRVDGSPFREHRRAKVEVFNIGEDRAEDQQTVRLIDELLDLVARNQSSIRTYVEGMVFADYGFAQQCGGNRNVESFNETGQIILQSEASNFRAGQAGGAASGGQHGPDFPNGLVEGCRITRFILDTHRAGGGGESSMDHIAWDFDVDGPAVPE